MNDLYCWGPWLGFWLFLCLFMVASYLYTRWKLYHLFAQEPLRDTMWQANQLHDKWLSERQQIQLNPIPAYFLPDPADADNQDLGVLGIVGDDLIFESTLNKRLKISLSTLDALEWIKEDGRVCLHEEQPDGWRIYVFHLLSTSDLVQCLEEVGHIPNITGRIGGDLGAVKAQLLTQDIYGQWNVGSIQTIYLAPDRLLLNWTRSISWAEFRGLSLIPNESAETTLLRIDYDSLTDQPQVIGLIFAQESDAESWADALHRLTDVPYEHLAGRKKKSEKDETVL